MRANRAAWGLVFLAALVLYVFDNNAATRALVLAAALLPLVSALALYLPRYAASAALSLPETLRRGETAEGRAALKLSGPPLVPEARLTLTAENLFLGERIPLRFDFPEGRGERALPLRLRPEHYGRYEVRVEALRLYDALGLFSRSLPCAGALVRCVAPETAPAPVTLADTADFLQDSERYSPDRAGYDPSETFRVRAYVPGDPVRRIHWKLTEKTGAAQVRDFGLPVVDRLLLLPDFLAPLTPEAADAILESLRALSLGLLAQGTGHAVGWRDGASGAYAEAELSAPEDLDALMALLLSGPAASEESAVAAYLGCYERCAHAHVALLAPRVCPMAARLCRGNRVTALLPAAGAEETEAEGVTVLPLTPERLIESGAEL